MLMHDLSWAIKNARHREHVLLSFGNPAILLFGNLAVLRTGPVALRPRITPHATTASACPPSF